MILKKTSGSQTCTEHCIFHVFHSLKLRTQVHFGQGGISREERVNTATAAAAKSLQSCPTLCDPVDGSPPGSPVSGILQARTLEWVAISFSNG